MPTLSLAARQARLRALIELLEDSADAEQRATLTLYPGAQPAGADTAPGEDQPALCVLRLPHPIDAEIDGTVLRLSGFEEGMATRAGRAAWARLADAAGAGVLDLSVGGPESGAELTLASTQFYPGVLVRVESAALAEV